MTTPAEPLTDLRTLAAHAQVVGREQFLHEFPHPWLVRAGVTSEYPTLPEPHLDPTMDTLPAAKARLNMWVGASAAVWPVTRRAGRSGDRVLVGRDPESDVVISSPAVSKTHACFITGSDEVLLMDVGSKNGTEVDRRPLAPERPVPLRDNHALRFGGIVSALYCTTELLWRLFESGALGIDPIADGGNAGAAEAEA